MLRTTLPTRGRDEPICSSSRMSFKYREDIDWLRAIAVLAVVAFHLDVPPVYRAALSGSTSSS